MTSGLPKMMPVKSEPPSPSSTGEGEEVESYDLYTPDTPEASGSSTAPTNNRKRSSTASGTRSSAKRPCTATSRKKKGHSKAQPKGKPRARTPTFVLGVDFGTTHSGMAHAHSGNASVGAVPILKWDDTNTGHAKIPSAIKFGPQDDIWGIDAKHLPDALRWFKLLLVNPDDLDEGIRTSAQLQKARDALQASGKSPVEAIGIFLKHMFEHAVEKLKIAKGAQTVDTSRFHVVFTVPAIWPQYARRSMQEAIEFAGILKKRPIGPTTYEFISEPEAAALATLSGLEGLPNFNAGETIVVVDCGGGTVDLITYKIVKTNPMTVQEFVSGKGALCGAIFVDERFRELVVKKLKEISEDAMERVSEQEMQEIMTRKWEGEIRNQFTGAAKTWTIRHPFSLINGNLLDRSKGYPTFTISSEEVKEVFRPIVEKIKSLVNSQIEAAVEKSGNLPKYATLVGGFGCSGYLREYLRQHCHGIEILQELGSEPWSAIPRGAVNHGMARKKFDNPLKVAVKARIARQSYGVVCEEPWNDEVHHPEDKWFDHILCQNVSIRVMKWHVVRGDEVRVDHTLSFEFTKFLDELPKEINTIIYTSATDPPSRRKDDSVVRAYELAWDIQVDWNSLETFENEEKKSFKKLEYTVEMKCSAGATAFSIYHGGYKQAARNVFLKFHEIADV